MAQKKRRDAQRFATWMRPKDALELISAINGQFAGRAIMERLKGGMIQAACGSWASSSVVEETHRKVEVTEIQPNMWENLEDESFFATGDAKFRVYNRHDLLLTTQVTKICLRATPSMGLGGAQFLSRTLSALCASHGRKSDGLSRAMLTPRSTPRI